MHVEILYSIGANDGKRQAGTNMTSISTVSLRFGELNQIVFVELFLLIKQLEVHTKMDKLRDSSPGFRFACHTYSPKEIYYRNGR